MKRKKKKEKRLPVLLLDDHPFLGQRGTVVMVKPGYYRFLIAKKLAVLASEAKLKGELRSQILSEKITERKGLAEELKEKIENIALDFKLPRDKSGKVFGSITKEKIVKALKEHNINVSKGQVNLEQKIKEPGNYNIEIKLGYGISANLKVVVK
jgi:large subunit ribosomal protein L9